MEVDIFLLIFVLVIVAGSVYVNIRILFYYQDPADDGIGQSIFVKGVVVISLTLCWLLNMLLPIDVRNSRPVPGILDMRLMWTIAFATLAVFLVVIIPAAMFYHEADGDVAITGGGNGKSQSKKVRRHVLCNMMVTLIFLAGGLGISYPFLAKAAVPVREYACPESHWLDASTVLTAAQIGAQVCASAADAHINFKVGLQVYMIAFMCFIGWFFFVTFGGIGLSALPIDLILEFVDRPKSIDKDTYNQDRREIGRLSGELLSAAEDLQRRDSELAAETGWRARRRKRALQADYNKWKIEVTFLQEDFEKLQISHHEKGESILVSAMKLVVGILFAILSILWILHMILYVIVRQYDPTWSSTFLNGLFALFEGPGLYPFGVALFAAFNLYLLLCVVKGCLKFGMRIFIFFSIHPMKMKATPLNSILFNILMCLISSAAVVQFSQEAFSDYARLTDADVLFAGQIKYLEFFVYFFENNVFLYILLGWFLLTLIYLIIAGPRDRKAGRKRTAKKGETKQKKKWRQKKKDDHEKQKEAAMKSTNST